MKRVLEVGFLLLFSLSLLQCGGGSKLAVEEYNELPAQDRIAYLEQRARDNPDDLAVKRQLYREYVAVNMIPQALRVMENLIVQNPGQTEVLFEYGELQYQANNPQRAYRAFLAVMQSPSADFYKSRVANYVAGGYREQRITSSPADEGFPVFSPDGKKLLYQRRSGDNWDIVEFEISTRLEKVLVNSPADEESPVYLATGNQVVYTSTGNDRRPIDGKFKVRDIALLDKSDRFVRNLTQSFADDWLPRLSHDGQRIVFVSDRDDLRKVSYVAKQSDIFVMEKDGDFQLQLTNTPSNEGGACFSSDDKRIFFHSNRNGSYDIFMMRRDGSQVMTVVDQLGNDVNPHASPDGAYLTFVSDRTGNYEIYLCDTNGSSQEQLTFSPGIDSNPSFSPDGKSIVFHSDRNGNYDIYLISLRASTSSAVTVNGLIDRLNGLIN